MSETRQAMVHIQAEASDVLAVLLDAAALPEWNPAFSQVYASGPATEGQSYPLRVKGFVRGELVYDRITEHEVSVTMRAWGLTEQGSWRLSQVPGGTLVTHTFRWSGALAGLLEPSTSEVATLRVNRLRERVADPHAVIG